MRCESCAKFVSLEMAEPEVESLDIEDDGSVHATVRIVRNCVECGDELKESTLEMEDDIGDVAQDHEGDDCELMIEEGALEAIEEGGGRYAKSYFGATLGFIVTCSCKGEEPIYSGELSDKVAASEMEEMV